VVNSIALKDAGGTVIELYGEVDGQFALRMLEYFMEAGVEAEALGGYFKLL
jgi:hypothetical protein